MSNVNRMKAAQSRQQKTALEQGQQRTAAVETKVREAMRVIALEITANEGIYPGNGGALSAAELCRRAGIHTTTLHGKKYGHFLVEVNTWVKEVKTSATIGRLSVRKTLVTRISEWQAIAEGLRQSERDTNLALQQKEVELQAATDKVAHLQDRVERLQESLNALPGKVVHLRRD